MFYKKEENNWFVGIEITLPTNPFTILTESNRINEYGWIWFDEPPIEYLEYIKENEIIINNDKPDIH